MKLTAFEQQLLVERYQPRHLTPTGEPMPAVSSFDDFIASLRQEAANGYSDIDRAKRERQQEEKALNHARQAELVSAALERRKEAHERREAKAREASASIRATLEEARESERLMAEVRKSHLDPFQVISKAMDSGLSYEQALEQLGGKK
jgi:hypothetical protein